MAHLPRAVAVQIAHETSPRSPHNRNRRGQSCGRHAPPPRRRPQLTINIGSDPSPTRSMERAHRRKRACAFVRLAETKLFCEPAFRDRVNVRSCRGLHRHALMVIIPCAFVLKPCLEKAAREKCLMPGPPQPPRPQVRRAVLKARTAASPPPISRPCRRAVWKPHHPTPSKSR